MAILIDYLSQLSQIQKVMLCVGIGSFLIQMIYWILIYGRTAFYKPLKNSEFTEPISIIICARNEAENLQRFLPSVLNQNYPNFEVIVVNDCSTDESDVVLFKLMLHHKNLYYTNIPEDTNFSHGKKLAMSVGIKAARNEHLLFTDADCETLSTNWISEMAQSFTPETEIILGISGFRIQKGFVNMLARFENLYTAMQYISFAKNKMPYMGIGRNLAYKKSLFYKQRGFAGYTHLVSGDDDLFVNKAANAVNTNICFEYASQTVSDAKTTFSGWLRQKQRHLSVSKYYKFQHKIILGLEPLSKLLVLSSLIFMLFDDKLFLTGLILMIMYYLIRTIILYLVSSRFKAKNIMLLWPIFDIFIPLIYLYITLTSIFKPKAIQWK